MGQRWSMLKNRYLEESESEERNSESQAQLQQSQATTEASSSEPAFDNQGLCSTCLNDVELSSLQSGDATVDTRTETTPTPSASHLSSVKGSLKDSDVPCKLRPSRAALDCKVEAYREALHGQFTRRKLGTNAVPSLTSLVPPPLTSDVAKLLDLAQGDVGEEKMPHSLTGHAKVGEKRKMLPSPFSSAQTLLMFQLDPKQKRPAGLPSLAFDYASFPTTQMKLKARTPLARPNEGVAAGEAVLDLGTGDAMVGRCVKKVVEGQRECRRGHVSCYNTAQRLYQVALLLSYPTVSKNEQVAGTNYSMDSFIITHKLLPVLSFQVQFSINRNRPASSPSISHFMISQCRQVLSLSNFYFPCPKADNFHLLPISIWRNHKAATFLWQVEIRANFKLIMLES